MNREAFCRYQEETFDAFCKRIIHNVGIDEKKKAETRERRESSLFELSEGELSMPPMELQPEAIHFDFLVHGMLVVVRERRIADALRVMRPELRNVLLLYYFCDMTMAQISKLTGLPVSTVDYRHKRALRQLRQLMEAVNHE